MEHVKQINDFLAQSSFFYTIAIGMDSRYSYVSDNYNRNFDQSKGSLLGKHFSVTLHPDDVVICEEVGSRCFQDPAGLYPATLRKHDGRGGYVVTQWEMQAFFDAAQQPAGIFCIGYNITEYINTQTRLENANSEIADKNDKLSEISFLQSHVVRKPLANIMGLAGLLDATELDDKQRRISNMITSSATELDEVIREITDKTVN